MSRARASALKVADAGLRRFMEAGTAERRLVLVEPVLPKRQLRFGRGADGRPRPSGFLADSGSEQSVDAVRKLLAQILDVEPRWLETSRTFLVETTAADLRRIVASRSVKSVHPNRRLRRF